ncbi:MAG TPA: N-6 DNA methylase [Kiritimatiellia bacterium]|nr:N-6 DNA methylase [Kiritimatiellia bacterium]
MHAAEFIAKWRKVELKERSAAQEHFLDLCRMLGHPTPAEADPTGETFCFEKGAEKHGGGDGFADVWKKDFFGWEYKGKHKDLSAAYDQLLLYRDALANPPLLVVCDLDRIVVHTNFTKTVSAAHEIPLERLGDPRSLEILRAVFFDPEKLRPGKTSVAITQEAAQHFADMAESMRKRGLDSAEVAHFLDRVVFCLFAEDIGLLPNQIFTRITEKAGGDPAKFGRFLAQLFAAMATGGEFGLETILHFNGNLFDGATVPDLVADEVARITASARLDWSAVEPSIFGTLFERGLDPAKRSQLGAHFTGKEDIDVLVEAVVMQPLRREWDETRQIVETLLATGKKKPGAAPAPLSPAARKKAMGEAEALIQRFMTRLQAVKVLDPACGSGNFLYVALQKLKDLEKTVYLHSMESGLASFFPMVGPWQLYGIELNPYAHDLAQMTVWIGWLQWLKFNGFGSPEEPILRAMSANFRCQDAILDLSDPEHPKEPDWPKVDFIVGNPPFLGGNRIRKELGGDYVDTLFKVYKDRVPAFGDLCCYWFEKARAHVEKGGCKRAGLLATQGIRGGANREVLKRIKESGDIFWAVSDQDWILDGATVHVSIAAFDNGSEETRTLDGKTVATINPDLTCAANVTQAEALAENLNICFMGPSPKAPFDVDGETARAMLAASGNPNKRPNSDVVRPVASAIDLVRGSRGCWTIDFGLMPMEEAAQYEAPFEYVKQVVKPARETRRDDYRGCWWQYARPRPEMREALKDLPRFIATPGVSKHRVFVWMSPEILCNQGTLVFARSDDCFFGILHSRIHEVWARAQGTQLREEESGARYTPTTSFETFPFPRPTPAQETAIAEAARELVAKRDEWLAGQDSKPRHLTRLYNERPTWLDLAHRKLDAAVFAAYGWDPALTDDALLAALLALNHERAVAESKHAPATRGTP